MMKNKDNKKKRLLALGFLSAPFILKWKQVVVISSIILILTAIPVSPEVIPKGHWQLLDDNTLTPLNESYNVSIGDNRTTEFKLNAVGNVNLSGLVYHYDVGSASFFLYPFYEWNNLPASEWNFLMKYRDGNEVYFNSPQGEQLIFSSQGNALMRLLENNYIRVYEDMDLTPEYGESYDLNAWDIESDHDILCENILNVTDDANIDGDSTTAGTTRCNGAFEIGASQPKIRFDDTDFLEQDTYLQSNRLGFLAATITLPSATCTLPGLSLANRFTGNQEFIGFYNEMAYQLRHDGDTHTYMQYEFDRIRFYAAGFKMLSLEESFVDEVIINDDGYDINTRIETNNNAVMFFVDGGNDVVGINTSTPNVAYELDVDGNIECTSIDQTSDERVKTLIGQLPKNQVKQFCENISILRFAWNDYSYIYENYTECWEEDLFNESSGEWENYTVCENLTRKIGIDYGEATDDYDVGIPAQHLFQYINESFGEAYAHALVHVPENKAVELWNVNYKSVSLIFARYSQILAEELETNNIMTEKLVRWANSLPEPYTFYPSEW